MTCFVFPCGRMPKSLEHHDMMASLIKALSEFAVVCSVLT